jgi:hypothetical protein
LGSVPTDLARRENFQGAECATLGCASRCLRSLRSLDIGALASPHRLVGRDAWLRLPTSWCHGQTRLSVRGDRGSMDFHRAKKIVLVGSMDHRVTVRREDTKPHGQTSLRPSGNSGREKYLLVNEVCLARRAFDRPRESHTDKRVCPWHRTPVEFLDGLELVCRLPHDES